MKIDATLVCQAPERCRLADVHTLQGEFWRHIAVTLLTYQKPVHSGKFCVVESLRSDFTITQSPCILNVLAVLTLIKTNSREICLYQLRCRYAIVLQVFQVFMWLWLVNFIIGLGQMTLAGAFASYYWAFNKRKDMSFFPVASSFSRSVRLVCSCIC